VSPLEEMSWNKEQEKEENNSMQLNDGEEKAGGKDHERFCFANLDFELEVRL
jgi:hypothetical protein